MTVDVEISVGWGCVHDANSTIDIANSTILYNPDPMVPMVAFQNLKKNTLCSCKDGSNIWHSGIPRPCFPQLNATNTASPCFWCSSTLPRLIKPNQVELRKLSPIE